MRISCVKVNNYRNIDGIEVTFNPECNYIIGENNIGKSNFLTLLATVCNGKSFDEKDFADSEKPIEVELDIKLLPNEQGFFGDNFSPEDASLLKIRYHQTIRDAYPTIVSADSNESIPPKQLRKLNFLKYETTSVPSKELRLDTQKGAGLLISTIIERFDDSAAYITHNAIILFVLEIFTNYTEVKKFYQSYYPLIVVDEFQDTNCIAWKLLESVISEQTQLLFLGDSLQRIYGFIGALPGIMSKVVDEYGMERIELSKNYRFRNNPDMLKLDKNIRVTAASCFTSAFTDDEAANLPAFWGWTQQNEAEQVITKIKELLIEENTKIALLFRSRSKNAEIVETELLKNNLQYFYGMFTDEDPDYVEFHNKCQEMFIRRFGKSKVINKKALLAFSNSVKTAYAAMPGKTIDSLLKLLDALMKKVSVDYSDLAPEDKYTLLLDIFENRQLKQAMEYVDSRVILSTVHGAKGLEWDYVIVCDVEQWVFTFICRDCPSKLMQNGARCKLPNDIPTQMVGPLLDDLCVFYVALTRAKRQAFISASGERYNARGQRYTGGKVCCFALVDGVKLINAAKVTNN